MQETRVRSVILGRAHMLGEDGKHILSWKGSAHSLLFYYEAFKEEAFMTQSGCPVFYYLNINP